jgi:hypothetical protein
MRVARADSAEKGKRGHCEWPGQSGVGLGGVGLYCRRPRVGRGKEERRNNKTKERMTKRGYFPNVCL